MDRLRVCVCVCLEFVSINRPPVCACVHAYQVIYLLVTRAGAKAVADATYAISATVRSIVLNSACAWVRECACIKFIMYTYM